MTCINIGAGIVCVGSDDVLAIDTPSGRVRFEWHHYSGPHPTSSIGPKHPFWWAVSLWNVQGRRTDEDCVCVWHIPRPPTIDARGYIVDGGEEHWDWVPGARPRKDCRT